MSKLIQAVVKEARLLPSGAWEVIVETGAGVQRALAYPQFSGEPRPGDTVVVNTTAVDLSLGSGDLHFVLWNLSRSQVEWPAEGHIMKLRYTPLQHNVLSVEEPASPHHHLFQEVRSIEGMPVLVGGLHSQLAPAAAVLKEGGCKRVAYIMTDGAALPLAFSQTVQELKEKGLLDVTITTGGAFGGDIEAVNIHTALVAARYVAEAEVAVVIMGPGVTGTRTYLGTTALEQGPALDAANALGGTAIHIPRVSFAEKRARHHGLSMHTVAVLTLATHTRATVAMPEMPTGHRRLVEDRIKESGIGDRHRVVWLDASATGAALEKWGLRTRTMGRGYADDPAFFEAPGAAALCALECTRARSVKP